MSYIGQGLPADTFQGFVTERCTGDGSATTFTLSKEPFSEDTLMVVINNVIQKPTTNFTVSGTTLTIVGTAVASGDVIYAIHMGGPLPIGGASELDLNGASDKLILDADGDTTISADTDDQIDIKVGGSDVVTIGSSNLTIDISGNIRLDADDNGEVRLLDGGTQYGALKVDSSRLKIQGIVSDADMLFVVNDGGSEVTALSFDASESGNAVFNGKVNVGASTTTKGSVIARTDPIDSGVFAAAGGMHSIDDRDPKPGNFPTGQYSNFSAYAGTGGGSPYADVMILDTFGHSSGGNANAIFVSKTDPNDIKIAQQTTQSTSTFVSGTVTDIDTTSSSDASVKENVQNITGALDKIAQLRPVTFEWTDEYINNGMSKNDEEKQYTGGELATFYEEGDTIPEGKKVGDVKTEGSAATRVIPDTKVTNVGLIAQEVEAVIPTVVHQRRVSLAGTNNYLKNIDYDKLVPHLIGAVKELKAKVEALEDA